MIILASFADYSFMYLVFSFFVCLFFLHRDAALPLFRSHSLPASSSLEMRTRSTLSSFGWLGNCMLTANATNISLHMYLFSRSRTLDRWTHGGHVFPSTDFGDHVGTKWTTPAIQHVCWLCESTSSRLLFAFSFYPQMHLFFCLPLSLPPCVTQDIKRIVCVESAHSRWIFVAGISTLQLRLVL